jgi:hypothetical protein
MTRHLRRPASLLPFLVRLVPLVALGALGALGALVAGCGTERRQAGPGAGTLALETSTSERGLLQASPREGHPWFPLTPGRYADFRVRRFTVDEPTYIRVTMGHPEPFFGRLATPWVYADVPGQPLDDTLFGLRQYFSIGPDGSLLFHGAQNNGFMSYMEPPVRQLPAQVQVGASSTDTVVFRSFLPGGVPLVEFDQSFTWTVEERATLELPAGWFHAVRVRQIVNDVFLSGASRLVEAAVFGDTPVAALVALRDGTAEERLVSRARADALDARRPDEPAVARGLWFARHTGLVARDYPHGPGVDVINITTYERLDEGFGPVPEPSSAP